MKIWGKGPVWGSVQIEQSVVAWFDRQWWCLTGETTVEKNEYGFNQKIEASTRQDSVTVIYQWINQRLV